MCCLFKRTNRNRRNNSCFNSVSLCRRTPRTKRYLENDVYQLASNNNNCCCQCGCCPCCCEIAYNNDRCDNHHDKHYDTCETNFQTFSPESFYSHNHKDYC